MKPYGRKRPLNPEQIEQIRVLLVAKHKWRDVLLLSLGVDSLLRAKDLLKLRVRDVMNEYGFVRERILIRQDKNHRGVESILTDYTQGVLQYWIRTQKIKGENKGDAFIFSWQNGS